MPAREYTDSRVVADSRQYAVDRVVAVDRLVVESAADPYADYLVYDTFTGDGSLDAHTPEKDEEGGGYSEVVGDWAIAGGVLPGPGGDGDVAVIDVGVANHYAEIELTPGAGGAPGVIARYQDATHFWVALFNATSGKINIYVNDGGFSDKGNVATIWNAGDRMRLSCSGNDLKVYQNDVEKISITNATFNGATIIGLRQGLAAAQSFDNFKSKAE